MAEKTNDKTAETTPAATVQAALNPALTVDQTLATVWDREPCVYEATVSNDRKQIVYLPPTYVSPNELKHRSNLRGEFASLNSEAKKQAEAQQESEIKFLNLKEDEAKEYRARYSFWEVEEPAPLNVMFDSRVDTKNGAVNLPTLPAGLRRM